MSGLVVTGDEENSNFSSARMSLDGCTVSAAHNEATAAIVSVGTVAGTDCNTAHTLGSLTAYMAGDKHCQGIPDLLDDYQYSIKWLNMWVQ